MYIYKRHMEEERQMQSSSPFICRQRGRTATHHATHSTTLHLIAIHYSMLQHAATHIYMYTYVYIGLYTYTYMCICVYVHTYIHHLGR